MIPKTEAKIEIPIDRGVVLEGGLAIPPNAKSLVIFSHGSGSSRKSPRNVFVARVLNDASIATLLLDLLTEEEDANYEKRFDIELLTRRLIAATVWVGKQQKTKKLETGYFGASTGSASALGAAAHFGDKIHAVVSRGGRPDLVPVQELARVKAPTLLIVGGADHAVIEMNQSAFENLSCKKELTIVKNATHLFEEPGALEEVADLASKWFLEHFV